MCVCRVIGSIKTKKNADSTISFRFFIIFLMLCVYAELSERLGKKVLAYSYIIIIIFYNDYSILLVDDSMLLFDIAVARLLRIIVSCLCYYLKKKKKLMEN